MNPVIDGPTTAYREACDSRCTWRTRLKYQKVRQPW